MFLELGTLDFARIDDVAGAKLPPIEEYELTVETKKKANDLILGQFSGLPLVVCVTVAYSDDIVTPEGGRARRQTTGTKVSAKLFVNITLGEMNAQRQAEFLRLAEILEPLANSGAIVVTLNSTGRVMQASAWSGGTSEIYSDDFAATIAPTAAPTVSVDAASDGSNTFLTVDVEKDWWVLALVALAIIVTCLLCVRICLCSNRDRDTRDMVVKDQRLTLATRPHAGPIQPNDFDLTSDYLMAAARSTRSPVAGSNRGYPSTMAGPYELQSPYLDITDSPPNRHYYPPQPQLNAGLEDFPWSPPRQPDYHPASLQNPAFATDDVSRISGYNQAWHNVAASPERHYYPGAQGVPTPTAWQERPAMPTHREAPEYLHQMALSPHGTGGVRWDIGWQEGNPLQEADYNANVSPRLAGQPVGQRGFAAYN